MDGGARRIPDDSTEAQGRAGPWRPIGVAAPILVSLGVTLPWLLHPSGMVSDHPIHAAAASEWRDAWARGVAWPGHFDGVNAGLGSFWPSYYPPLFHVATAALMTLGMGYWKASGLIMVVAHTTGTGLCYGWLRRHVGPSAAGAGALAYAVAPYTIFNLYQRGAFPEGLAFSWLPGVLWSLDGLRRERDPRLALLGIVCLSLIALSNLPALVVSIYGIATYLSVTILSSRDSRGLARVVGVLAAGAGLTAFYWMPAWFDRVLVYTPTSELARDPSPFLFYHYGRFGLSPKLYLDWCIFLSLFWWQAALVVFVSGLIRPRASAWAGALAVVGLGLWLCTDLSGVAYRRLPLLSFLQFPWRSLGMVGGASALLIAGFVDRVRRSRLVTFSLLGAWGCLPLVIFWFSPPIDIDAVFPVAVMMDYIPVSARAPESSRFAISPIEASSGEPKFEIRCWVPGEIAVATAAPGPFELRVRTYWDRRWVAVDQSGRRLPTAAQRDDRLGRLTVRAPTGTTRVTLRLEPTRSARAGLAISLLTVVASAAWLVRRPG